MSDVQSSDTIKKMGKDVDPTRYQTRSQELARIDKLADSTWQMTDLRDEEIIVFSIYRSLDLGLQFKIKENGTEEMVGGLPKFTNLIESIRDMRPSRNRQSRREYIDALGKGRPIQPWELPPGFKQDEEPDRKPWWQFWRRG